MSAYSPFVFALLTAASASLSQAAEPVRGAERALTSPALNGNGLHDKNHKNLFDDPLAGVVINRTVTVQGKDFYQFFATLWRQKEVGSRFTISIHERPSARWGSEVWVQFRQKRMFHAFLPPARSATRKISAMAVEIVEQNIADSEVERIMVRSPDLGPEEM